jgi:hypothetical protein
MLTCCHTQGSLSLLSPNPSTKYVTALDAVPDKPQEQNSTSDSVSCPSFTPQSSVGVAKSVLRGFKGWRRGGYILVLSRAAAYEAIGQ